MVDLGTQDFWKRIRNDPAQLAAEVCTVDVVNLDETLQKHPALRAWVNAAHEVARIAEERLKWNMTKTRAIVLLRQKKAAPNKTVGVIDAEVETSAEVEEAMDKLLAQQEVRVALRAMANALEDRKDMLIQIAAKQRKELDDYR